MRKLLCLATVSFLAAGLASVPASAQTALTGDEIRSAVFGNTMTNATPSTPAWDLYVTASGDTFIRVALPNGRTLTDKGKASFEGSRFCIDWERPNPRIERCLSMARDGDKYTNRNADGSVSSIFTLRPGNAADLK